MSKEKDTKSVTVPKSNLSEWYSQVIEKAELVDYAPIRGLMIIRPNGYAIWQSIQDHFNQILKEKKIDNAYFPLLIPESFFKREAEHAEGFSPELAHISEKENGEKLILRPTSETIIYDSFSKWIRSWRDLPLKVNQWANVIRWEVKQTKPFIRTREFLWQEGHCAFSSSNEAESNMNEIIQEYKKFSEEVLAIPVLVGKKSLHEKFAGAETTMTIEALMPDGKALQMGTSHNLGQGFSKAFNVSFKDELGKDKLAHLTSWGVSTRLIGAIVMVHGDDKGLVLPPRIARNKIAIVPIIFEDTKSKVLKKAKEVEKKLSEFSPILDDREGYSAGWKFSEYELKGLPLRLEIGPKDLEKKQVTLVRRDTGEKISVKETNLKKEISKILGEIQSHLFKKAKKLLDSNITEASNLKQLKEGLKEGKIVKSHLLNDKKIEEKLKDECEATSRIIESGKEGACVITGKKTNTIAYIARSY